MIGQRLSLSSLNLHKWWNRHCKYYFLYFIFQHISCSFVDKLWNKRKVSLHLADCCAMSSVCFSVDNCWSTTILTPSLNIVWCNIYCGLIFICMELITLWCPTLDTEEATYFCASFLVENFCLCYFFYTFAISALWDHPGMTLGWLWNHSGITLVGAFLRSFPCNCFIMQFREYNFSNQQRYEATLQNFLQHWLKFSIWMKSRVVSGKREGTNQHCFAWIQISFAHFHQKKQQQQISKYSTLPF